MPVKRSIRHSRRGLCLELLEDRTLLAGNITATVNNGLLTITGAPNDTDDDVQIFQTEGSIAVFSEGSTVNGQSPAQGSIPFSSVNAISIRFFDGITDVSIFGIHLSGAISIIQGIGNNFTQVDDSMFSQLDATVGREQNGAKGNMTVEIASDVITGEHLNVNLLNESGVSGKRLGGANGMSPGSHIDLSMLNLTFTNGGHLNVRADDGIPYFDTQHQQLLQASQARIETVNTAGNMGIVLGDHFQRVLTDGSTARNLALSVGRDNDFVEVGGSALNSRNTIKRSETVTVGNNSPFPVPILPSPLVRVSGSVGSNLLGDALRLTVGSNTNTTIPAWDVQVVDTTVLGDLTIVAGNGVAALVDPTSDSRRLDISMGSGGVNGLESLTLLGVMSNDPLITFASNVGDTVNINFTNVQVTDPFDIFQLQDTGHGKDNVILSDLHVAGFLFVFLSDSGHNMVTADHVTTTFGLIFGGAGFGDQFHDGGGNSGFFVFGFP